MEASYSETVVAWVGVSWANLVQILPHLADIATVIAALVAVLAINSWRANRLRELKQSEAIALLLAARDIRINVNSALSHISDRDRREVAVILVEHNSSFIRNAEKADTKMKEAAYRLKLLTGEDVSGQKEISGYLLELSGAFSVLKQFRGSRGLSAETDQFLDEQVELVMGRNAALEKIDYAIGKIDRHLQPVLRLKG